MLCIGYYKNGYGDMVFMSMETFEAMRRRG